jgi:hypothetical protein
MGSDKVIVEALCIALFDVRGCSDKLHSSVLLMAVDSRPPLYQLSYFLSTFV